MIYQTRGIILRRINLGETDRIITVLTEDFGKIKVLAKGVRKTLSKMAGHLEPFCLTKLQIVEGKNLDIFTGAQVEKSFLDMRIDLAKTNACFYMAEIIDKMIEEGDKHVEIFDLLNSTLEHVNILSGPLLVSYFEINFLAETGFRPELYSCIKCQNKIKQEKNNFDFAGGGLTCQTCSVGSEISEPAIKLIRLCLKHSFSEIKKIKLTPELISEVGQITGIYIKHIHQNDFKSQKYLIN